MEANIISRHMAFRLSRRHCELKLKWYIELKSRHLHEMCQGHSVVVYTC